MSRRSFLKYFREMSFYALLFGIAMLLFSSCKSYKKSANLRRIERHSRKNPDPSGATLHRKQGRKVRAALKKEEKREKEIYKERKKEVKRGVNRRHLKLQDRQTRRRINKASRKVERERRRAK